jgi:hypothetical protein
MAKLPSVQRWGADLRSRFCVDLVDGLREDLIGHADLPVVQAVSIAGEKIDKASAHIDAVVRRAIAQDCIQIVKEKRVGLGHRYNTRTEGDLAPSPDTSQVKIGSVPKSGNR